MLYLYWFFQYSYNGGSFTNHPNAASKHFQTTLGDLENKILAVGGYSTSNKIVEVFDISSNKWSTKTAFPWCSSRLV